MLAVCLSTTGTQRPRSGNSWTRVQCIDPAVVFVSISHDAGAAGPAQIGCLDTDILVPPPSLGADGFCPVVHNPKVRWLVSKATAHLQSVWPRMDLAGIIIIIIIMLDY